jgi:uncharacterized membrane protein YdbT with pleckstrin-like domain
MSYVERNLVPGETLIYQTRHHWMVLIGPTLVALLFGVPGILLLVGAVQARNGNSYSLGGVHPTSGELLIPGILLMIVAIVALGYGVTKRNATEMAVTNRRVLIKTGMGSRRTLDLMLSRVESIGVEESMFGRMVGYGTVIVRGTGGTPESFVKIGHPQEFRRAVQEQIGQEHNNVVQ